MPSARRAIFWVTILGLTGSFVVWAEKIGKQPGSEFLAQCAFVCVDIQEGPPPVTLTQDQVPALWRQMGFTTADVNAANTFAYTVALPNAVRAADACRRAGLPMIFIHWGCQFKNGMDLDPEIRRTLIDATGHVALPDSPPAKALGIRDGEYVVPKTAQDAFRSSNLEFLLHNLGVKHLIFVGGHTEACLGKTAKSAKRLGFRTMCITDATNNARESTREKGIDAADFDYQMSVENFLQFINKPPTK